MKDRADHAMECPICGKINNCGNGNPVCWCSKEYFPNEIFDLVPAGKLKKSCICKECLERFKKQ